MSPLFCPLFFIPDMLVRLISLATAFARLDLWLFRQLAEVLASGGAFRLLSCYFEVYYVTRNIT
jgi:hypothetical protein